VQKPIRSSVRSKIGHDHGDLDEPRPRLGVSRMKIVLDTNAFGLRGRRTLGGPSAHAIDPGRGAMRSPCVGHLVLGNSRSKIRKGKFVWLAMADWCLRSPVLVSRGCDRRHDGIRQMSCRPCMTSAESADRRHGARGSSIVGPPRAPPPLGRSLARIDAGFSVAPWKRRARTRPFSTSRISPSPALLCAEKEIETAFRECACAARSASPVPRSGHSIFREDENAVLDGSEDHDPAASA